MSWEAIIQYKLRYNTLYAGDNSNSHKWWENSNSETNWYTESASKYIFKRKWLIWQCLKRWSLLLNNGYRYNAFHAGNNTSLELLWCKFMLSPKYQTCKQMNIICCLLWLKILLNFSNNNSWYVTVVLISSSTLGSTQ